MVPTYVLKDKGVLSIIRSSWPSGSSSSLLIRLASKLYSFSITQLWIFVSNSQFGLSLLWRFRNHDFHHCHYTFVFATSIHWHWKKRVIFKCTQMKVIGHVAMASTLYLQLIANMMTCQQFIKIDHFLFSSYWNAYEATGFRAKCNFW